MLLLMNLHRNITKLNFTPYDSIDLGEWFRCLLVSGVLGMLLGSVVHLFYLKVAFFCRLDTLSETSGEKERNL